MNAKFMMAMMQMYGLAMMANNFTTNPTDKRSTEPTKAEWEAYERKVKEKQIALMKKQGMKEFWYPECTIIALNQKNADRKYKNLMRTITTEEPK